MRWKTSTYSDAQMLAWLQERIAAGQLHPANLEGFEGKGTLANRIAAGFFATMRRLATLLPQSWGYALFGGLFVLIGMLFPPARARINMGLAYAFPGESRARLATIRRKFWRGFGYAFFETLDFDRFMNRLPDTLQIEGQEHVARAKAAGKPIVFVHAHQANWEFAFSYFADMAGPATGIYAVLRIPQMQRQVLFRRAYFGIAPYPRHFRGAIGQVVKDLRAGKNLIIAMDQRTKGQPVKFFGQWAKTTDVPIKLAQRADAHLIPVRIERGVAAPRDLRLTFCANLLDQGTDTSELLEAYNRQLEGWIKERPEDWFWLHDRWRQDPKMTKEIARLEGVTNQDD